MLELSNGFVVEYVINSFLDSTIIKIKKRELRYCSVYSEPVAL